MPLYLVMIMAIGKFNSLPLLNAHNIDQSDIAPYIVPKPSEGKKVLPKEPDSDSAEIDEIMDDRGNWNS